MVSSLCCLLVDSWVAVKVSKRSSKNFFLFVEISFSCDVPWILFGIDATKNMY